MFAPLHHPGEGRKSVAMTSSGMGAVALALATMLAVLPTSPPPGVAASTTVVRPCGSGLQATGPDSDSGPALQACLDATSPGGILALPAGRYRIATPVTIRHPLTLTTRGVPINAPPCAHDETQCATLQLAIAPSKMAMATMPFAVEGSGVRLDHLVFEGTRRTDPALSARRCAANPQRPMAGGLRVNGNAILIRRSTFRDMACYSALEYGTGIDTVIADNDFVGNGIHTTELHWADGLTIHDAKHLVVKDNRFRDNTDVQLILGGCTDCLIVGNNFRHGSLAAGGAFAELMLQAWPKATSGDFTGSRILRNDIDCGAMRRCGFGIMIGSAPWYDAPAFGGAVTANRVRRAMLALDIDSLSAPMVVGPNDLAAIAGTYPSACGPKRIVAAVNVSPASRPFLLQPPSGNSRLSYRGCILNYQVIPPTHH